MRVKSNFFTIFCVRLKTREIIQYTELFVLAFIRNCTENFKLTHKSGEQFMPLTHRKQNNQKISRVYYLTIPWRPEINITL